MTNSDNRLDLLQRALDAFVAWREDPNGPSAGQFLAGHPELRSLLEPMVHPEGDEDAESPKVDVGTRLGDFALLRLLGQGGMGRVFEARQISLDRRVTVKVLNAQLTRTPAAIERFRREAAAAARLRHPGIVPIFEVGERGGVHFFAMEHVAGRPLNELLQDDAPTAAGTRPRQREAARIVAEAAEALHYAHEHGVVHRDVKPHNLLIAEDGTVRLLDFGLASDLARDPAGRDRGGLAGTPHYMSPEQARGDEVGPASDVFSCGVVLYELLTGERPFDGASTTAVLARILDAEPPSFVAPGAQVPRDLASICRQCLRREPAARYASALALAADLRAWLGLEPISAAPPSAVRRAWQYVRRHPARAAAMALAITTAIALPTIWWLQRAIADERAGAQAAAETAIDAMGQLIGVLDDRLARQQELEPGYERQIEAATELCAARLRDPAIESPHRENLANAILDAAEIYPRLGSPRSALAPIQQAIDGLGAGDNAAARLLRARAFGARARIRHSLYDHDVLGDIEAAKAEWSTLRTEANSRPAASAALARLAILEARIALDELTGVARAGERLAEARALLDELPAPDSLASCQLHVATGTLHLHREDPAAAAAEFEAAAALFEADDRGREHPELRAQQLLGAGTAALKQNDLDTARAHIEQASAAIAESATRYPSDADLQRTRAMVHHQLGRLHLLQRKYEAARGQFGIAFAAWEALLSRSRVPSGRDAMAFAVTCTQLANCHLLEQPPEPKAARPMYHKALELQRELLEAEPGIASHLTELAATHSNLAAWENQFGSPEKAQKHALEAIGLQEAAYAERPESRRIQLFLAIHHAQLAYAEHALADTAAALAAARRAIGFGPTHAATVRMCAEIATKIAAGKPEPIAAAAADELRAESVGWLRGLTRGSARGIEHLLAQKSFDSLRDRADFQQLEREVAR